jgi:hypothetical protein
VAKRAHRIDRPNPRSVPRNQDPSGIGIGIAESPIGPTTVVLAACAATARLAAATPTDDDPRLDVTDNETVAATPLEDIHLPADAVAQLNQVNVQDWFEVNRWRIDHD